MSTTFMRWLLVGFAVVLLSGCGSYRYASTLKPSGNGELSFGATNFCLTSIEYEKKEGGSGQTPADMEQAFLAQKAKELYPKVFTEDWTALPVRVRITADPKGDNMAPFVILSTLTAWIVPLPMRADGTDFSVQSTLRGAEGEKLVGKTVDFSREDVVWFSLFGPLGALPVPGQSDLPRDGIFLMIPVTSDAYKEVAKSEKYSTACVVEAIVEALRQADPDQLAAAAKARRARLQEVTIDGTRYWCFLAPAFSEDPDQQDQADLFSALFYRDYPKRDARPLDDVIVARRGSDGRWQPVSGYLHSGSRLTAASVLLEDGKPNQVVLREVEEPPLEDFLDLSEGNAADLRWSNSILLQAKNKSLPRLLREKSVAELLDLTTRIEQAALDLNEQAERAKDRAQRIVEKGEGDPGPERELAILCRQRIEVLKPILAELKQEVALRR